MVILNQINIVGDPISTVVKKYSTKYSTRKLKTYGLAHPLSEEDVEYMRNSFANRDPQVANPYGK